MREPIPDWAADHFELRGTSVDGEPVVYLAGGSGPPVVMLHGLSASLDWWQFNASAIAEHFTVFLLDLPGFGRMGHQTAIRAMPDYANWVIRFIDAVDLRSVHLVGHSMGGHLAVRIAATYPERVTRLVLVGPAGVLPDSELEHYVLPIVKLLREIPPRMFPLALRDIRLADLRTTWQSGQSLIEHDVLSLLPEVRASTLLIWGADDPVVPLELAETFLERLPDARLTTYPHGGHIPMVHDPERFNRDVINFLAKGAWPGT